MSKSLIAFLVMAAGIVALVLYGVPAMESTPQYESNGVHYVDGVLSEEKPMVIGKFKPIHKEELSETEKAFVEMVMIEGGVYRQGDLFVLSLREEPIMNQSLQFVRQENHTNEIRFYVKKGNQAGDSNLLLGRMELSESLPFSFIDADTGALIL